MTAQKNQAGLELMSADEAEVRAILEARYPNDRRLQRAMIRLAELRPEGRYTSMTDTADPAFQRIIPQAPAEGAEEATESGTPTPGPQAQPTAQPVALKVEPLVTTASATAGRPKAPGTATGPKSK